MGWICRKLERQNPNTQTTKQKPKSFDQIRKEIQIKVISPLNTRYRSKFASPQRYQTLLLINAKSARYKI